jgi:di- and tripeptidase
VLEGASANQFQVYNLETYKRIAVILGHRGSVLSLTLSEDGQLLFSSAGDRFVNVWDTKTLLRVYSIYSMYDIGDVFCVCYSSSLNTVYLGAQNTSIQVYHNGSILRVFD